MKMLHIAYNAPQAEISVPLAIPTLKQEVTVHAVGSPPATQETKLGSWFLTLAWSSHNSCTHLSKPKDGNFLKEIKLHIKHIFIYIHTRISSQAIIARARERKNQDPSVGSLGPSPNE